MADISNSSAASSSSSSDSARERILALARAEGFELVRFAAAAPMAQAREAALDRHREGCLEGMDWITPAWLKSSTDPEKFLPGARTFIVVALPTHSPGPAGSDHPKAGGRGRIARYARGRDYHRIFEKALRRMAGAIRREFGAAARATVDYGPLLERPVAAAAGLGWQGKSTMLLAPGFGPWLLLGVIATTLELAPDLPLRKTCGSCTRCIVACPTGALSPNGHVLDSRLCISYHTIENRGPIPRDLRPKFGDWIFGCDDCLDSCPVGVTRFQSHPEFQPVSADDAFPPLAPLLAITVQEFVERFRGRPIRRARRDGFVRNVCIALGNVGTAEDFPAVAAALDDASPLVRGHAAWAVGRLALRVGLEAEAHAVLEKRLAIEQDAFVREELAAALETLPREFAHAP